MGREISSMTVLAVVVLAAITGLHGTEAASYTVGGSYRWQTAPNSTFYSDWASGITFNVNDTLVFNFATGVHDVTIVTSRDVYDNCGSANKILNTGPAIVPLNTTGSTSTPSTPSPSVSPPATGTTSPPPPPPSGFAASLSAGLATMFSSIVMVYLILFY